MLIAFMDWLSSKTLKLKKIKAKDVTQNSFCKQCMFSSFQIKIRIFLFGYSMHISGLKFQGLLKNLWKPK